MISRRQISRLLLLLGALLAVAAMDPPSQPIVLSPEQAAKEGRALVDEMLSQKPADTDHTAVMTIRDAKNKRTEIPVRFEIFTLGTNWFSRYATTNMDVLIIHDAGGVNQYRLKTPDGKGTILSPGEAVSTSFAGSDFSIADFGLEFLHWPDQRLLQKEMRRSRSCRVLESINPHPDNGGYSRVKSWVDAESHGILYAEAYDVKGNKIKEFYPKDFDKVDGQWQLHEMQIDNVQKKSSTTVKFDLK